MIDVSYIMGFIGVAVGVILGIFIYSQIDDAIDCPDSQTYPSASQSCARTKGLSWTVIGILPVTMFFALFGIFGGFSKTT